MVIITDSREQRNQHILEKFSNLDIPFKIKKLDFGDYSMAGYEDKIVIERKASLTEIAANFCKGRDRFEAEFTRATESGAKIYLLIEDGKGRDKIKLRQEMDKDKIDMTIRHKKTWRTNFTGNSMVASIVSWKEKYKFEIIFCNKKDTGEIISKILKQYMQNLGGE